MGADEAVLDQYVAGAAGIDAVVVEVLPLAELEVAEGDMAAAHRAHRPLPGAAQDDPLDVDVLGLIEHHHVRLRPGAPAPGIAAEDAAPEDADILRVFDADHALDDRARREVERLAVMQFNDPRPMQPRTVEVHLRVVGVGNLRLGGVGEEQQAAVASVRLDRDLRRAVEPQGHGVLVDPLDCRCPRRTHLHLVQRQGTADLDGDRPFGGKAGEGIGGVPGLCDLRRPAPGVGTLQLDAGMRSGLEAPEREGGLAALGAVDGDGSAVDNDLIVGTGEGIG